LFSSSRFAAGNGFVKPQVVFSPRPHARFARHGANHLTTSQVGGRFSPNWWQATAWKKTSPGIVLAALVITSDAGNSSAI